jgi:hypothetical protein
MDKILLCSACQFKILDDWFFCPNCGKNIKEKITEISVSKQILIYAVSFFLAPLGLGWGLKYIGSKNKKIKTVGMISIALTIASIILMMLSLKGFVDQYVKTLNQIM